MAIRDLRYYGSSSLIRETKPIKKTPKNKTPIFFMKTLAKTTLKKYR